MKEFQRFENVIHRIIENVYNQGYENGLGKAQTDSYVKGYEDGKADTPFTDTEEAEKTAYENGMNAAWDAAKRANEIDDDVYDKLFPKAFIEGFYEGYTAKEVIERLAKYEDKQKQDAEIKVGYEVYNLDPENKRIVTAIDGNKAIQLCSNGKYTIDNIDTLHWTGREDLRIKKVLEKITNEI